jgi:hypothetical protein
MDVRTVGCPWCGGELFASVADVVLPNKMIGGGPLVKKDRDVAECAACEFIAEPVPTGGILVAADRKTRIWSFKQEDVQR